MKKYFALFIGILFVTNLFADTWEKFYGGSSNDDGISLQKTQDDGFIIVGSTESFGAGGSDIYLIRTDSSGDTLWTKTYGGAENDWGYSVQQTDDGGFIIAGATKSFGTGVEDVYLIKTNSSGDTIWTKTFGGDTSDYGCSVQSFSGGIDGYIIVGYTYSFGEGENDVYLIKTNSNGDTLWTKTFGGTGYDRGNSIQQTSDSNFIIAGATSSLGDSSGAAYLIKINSSGDTLWTRIYDNPTLDDRGSSALQCKDKGFIIAGSSIGVSPPYMISYAYVIRTDSSGDTLWTRTFTREGALPFVFANSVQECPDNGFIFAGSTGQFGANNDDVYLVKIDSYGDTLWTKTYGGTNTDVGRSVQQTSDGGFIVAGLTHYFVAGNRDVYLIKTDSVGNIAVEESKELRVQSAELRVVKNKICLNVAKSINAELKIYDLCGRMKEVLYSGTLNKGNYVFTPSIRKSGIYFVRLMAGNYKETNKLVLIK